MISNNTIEQVMLPYENQLRDITSYEYKFFYKLVETRASHYEVFSKVFEGLAAGNFDIYLIRNFLQSFNLELTIEGIQFFLKSFDLGIDLYRLDSLRKMLFNNTYKEYGNFNSFVKNLFSDDNESNLYFKKEEVDSELFKDDRSYLLIPKIDNYGNEQNYGSFREAEEDYWTKIGAWKTATANSSLVAYTYTMQLSDKLIGYLLTKRYSNVINGTPILMEKISHKPMYSNIKDIDDLVASVFKGEYKHLSIKEVYYFIDKMLSEMILYHNLENIEFNYEDEQGKPDLNEFFLYKINNITASTLRDTKEVKFYLYLIKEFLRINNDDVTDLISLNGNINSDFEKINTVLTSLRSYLLQNGKFLEY
jgi:hypothetical protein